MTAIKTPTLSSAGRVLVDSLRLHGVDRVFCVPGESYLEVLDALHDVSEQIQLVVAKHEGGLRDALVLTVIEWSRESVSLEANFRLTGGCVGQAWTKGLIEEA